MQTMHNRKQHSCIRKYIPSTTSKLCIIPVIHSRQTKYFKPCSFRWGMITLLVSSLTTVYTMLQFHGSLFYSGFTSFRFLVQFLKLHFRSNLNKYNRFVKFPNNDIHDTADLATEIRWKTQPENNTGTLL